MRMASGRPARRGGTFGVARVLATGTEPRVAHFMVGITNWAPSRWVLGHREVTVLSRV
jgi:hypothetical protein